MTQLEVAANDAATRARMADESIRSNLAKEALEAANIDVSRQRAAIAQQEANIAQQEADTHEAARRDEAQLLGYKKAGYVTKSINDVLSGIGKSVAAGLGMSNAIFDSMGSIA